LITLYVFLNSEDLNDTVNTFILFSSSSVYLCFQYVVIPTRRSAAEAVQILMSHLLGDAGSPYLIGVVGFCVPHLIYVLL